MAVNIKFDLTGNPELPTIILANRNGNKLGQLQVNAESVDLSDKFNDASEISFTVNKYIDEKPTPLWDKLVDFKLVYCKEWDLWFEIKVELDEETETVKTVFCTQLGQAELSQIMLYDIEINTEEDIARDDYKISILWDKNNPKSSILDRMLEKAPHYSIIHVDDTIKDIQRSFSFDSTSIHDGFQEIAEEIGCLFVYHSNSGENGKIQRTISVYDLQQNCNDCGHRGEFTDRCPKCGSTNIKQGYGEDTLIFVTSDELTSEGIELVTDTDAVKNCFKLKAGDDLMTATIRNCNPNGTDYIWYFSDVVKEDMSANLVEKLNSYDGLYKDYYDNHESKLDTNLVNKYNALVEKYEGYYNTKSTCLNCDYKGIFENACPQCDSTNILSGKNLQSIPTTIKGYSSLMNNYYNTIDLALYLKSGLMPSVEMSDTNAQEQADLLIASFPSSVAVNTEYVEGISLATANSAALSMAKVIVKPTYKVEVKTSTLSDNKIWQGNFIINNYSDDNDTAESRTIEIVVNNDAETFIKQKIDKALNKEDTDDYSISGLFEKDYSDFCAELKKYALNPLKRFYEACDVCLNILIDNGVGNKDETPDLYEQLYEPYYKKSSALTAEIKIREEELAIIEGVWNKTDENNSELITKGLQQYIEECRNTIQSALDFEKYLGEELWLEFCAYRRDDTYSNENYISDGLNNAKLFERALEFYEVAENEIYKSAELQHSISTSLNNLLAIDKFKPLVQSFKVGNWIRVRVDDKIFKLRLLEYEINFGSFDNIPVEFSDVTKIKNGITDVKNVIEQASSMATSYPSIQRQANQGGKAKDVVEQWSTDGLNTTLVQIQNNNDEEVTMTKNGLLCRSFDDITGEYSSEQLKITHNIMAYTNDNWQTVRQAIGKHNYFVYSTDDGMFVNKLGYGMGADFVTAGVVSGSQIIGGDIYSVNYSNADGNKMGSYLNLTDGTFSFAGGKLTYDGDHLSVDGEITIATNGTIGCWNIDNFSIYKGSNIFGNSSGMYFGTDGLSLSNKFKVDSEGHMTSTSGTIAGWLIEENYIGLEIWDEDNCSNNVAISPTGVNANVSAFGGYNTCLLYFKDKFAVLEDGSMYSVSGKIAGWDINQDQITKTVGDYTTTLDSSTGTITTNNIIATGGSIGGWQIGSEAIYKTCASSASSTGYYKAFMQAASNPFSAAFGVYETDEQGATYGKSKFYITYGGDLYASNADITGVITATSGNFSDNVTIGGTKVTAGYLKNLYNYAVGGTGTPIKQINAEKGAIGNWHIGSVEVITGGSTGNISLDGALYSDNVYDAGWTYQVAFTPESVYAWGRDSSGGAYYESATWRQILSAAN